MQSFCTCQESQPYAFRGSSAAGLGPRSGYGTARRPTPIRRRSFGASRRCTLRCVLLDIRQRIMFFYSPWELTAPWCMANSPLLLNSPNPHYWHLPLYSPKLDDDGGGLLLGEGQRAVKGHEEGLIMKMPVLGSQNTCMRILV